MTNRLVVAVVLAVLSAVVAHGAVPPVPKISGPITGPGPMYPNPVVNVVATAVKVEDFPYVTEEFFVSGTIGEVTYNTRIIVRRPRDIKAFSGTVVSEALHSGGRSLIFEWSRLSILTRNHMFVEIVHSPANINLLKTFNAEDARQPARACERMKSPLLIRFAPTPQGVNRL